MINLITHSYKHLTKGALIMLLFTIRCQGINAQDATNTGSVFVSPGTMVTQTGNFTNTATGTFLNNGSLAIKGNLTNYQSSMAAGSGTLTLNGSTAQAVNGTQPFKTFNLVTDNIAGITLNNDLSVSGVHTFTNGIITTSVTPNYLIYEAGASYVSAADNRHVNGWVKKLGNTDFSFPVGNGTVERKIGIVGLTGTAEFNVMYASNTPNTNQVQSPLVMINPSEYWMVNKISGGSATLAMNWDNSKVAFPNWKLADLGAAYYNGSAWSEIAGIASGNPTTTGTITSNPVAAFNLFTIGSRGFLLPLDIVSFKAHWLDNVTHISWITAKEENVNHFEVQRSDNGNNFYTISHVAARNRGVTENYSTTDAVAIHGFALYRLFSVDNDGKKKYSNIVSISARNTDNSLKLVMNPAQEQIVLSAGTGLKGEFTYRISKVSGQLVKQGRLPIKSGGGLYTISLTPNTTSGLYILEVNNSTLKFTYKVIVQ